MVTVTPGTGRFCWSETVPRIEPVWTPWAELSTAKLPSRMASSAATSVVVRLIGYGLLLFVEQLFSIARARGVPLEIIGKFRTTFRRFSGNLTVCSNFAGNPETLIIQKIRAI